MDMRKRRGGVAKSMTKSELRRFVVSNKGKGLNDSKEDTKPASPWQLANKSFDSKSKMWRNAMIAAFVLAILPTYWLSINYIIRPVPTIDECNQATIYQRINPGRILLLCPFVIERQNFVEQMIDNPTGTITRSLLSFILLENNYGVKVIDSTNPETTKKPALSLALDQNQLLSEKVERKEQYYVYRTPEQIQRLRNGFAFGIFHTGVTESEKFDNPLKSGQVMGGLLQNIGVMILKLLLDIAIGLFIFLPHFAIPYLVFAQLIFLGNQYAIILLLSRWYIFRNKYLK